VGSTTVKKNRVLVVEEKSKKKNVNLSFRKREKPNRIRSTHCNAQYGTINSRGFQPGTIRTWKIRKKGRKGEKWLEGLIPAKLNSAWNRMACNRKRYHAKGFGAIGTDNGTDSLEYERHERW
jgi:hypothetical protein